MSIQPSVAEYFNNRKRPAADDLKKAANPSKVLVVDEVLVSKGCESIKNKHGTLPKKIVYIKKETNTLQTKKKLSSSNKAGQSSALKGNKGKLDGFQTDIRKSLFNVPNKKIVESNENKSNLESFKDESVCYEQCGDSGAAERSGDREVAPELPGAEECKSNVHSSLKTPQQSRQELNLGNVKAPMKSRSSRMEELKAALKRFNEKKAKLEDSESKAAAADSGKLDAKKIELEVIPSPLKTPTKMGHLLSPQGKLTPSRLFATPPPPQPQSPHKSPLKSPAFQRYQALVTEGRPALVLPFKYRALAELFRSIDTITSMLFNRKETVTMTKLRPAVQEMSRKNLTEYHLGQIKTVFPNSFDFKIEKFRTGSTEKYELVLNPMLSEDNKEGGGEVNTMGSSILLARRRALFNALLDLTKEHHEAFLKSLDPPMNIPRSRLTRWHPEFPVDDVPDIVSAALPQPPNVERVASAKDVLEKARSLFMLNPRMERALRNVSENSAAAAPSLSCPSTPITIPTPTHTTKSALHGVPASLLEKVRAKQAARALEAMTRTPAQAKEAVRLTRLPELARILRNLFVTEKKGVLTREMVLEKLADSYRESLSTGELDEHLKLLAEKTPGWVTFCNLRKTDYVKLCRNADMSRIMTRLEALAEEKCI